MSTLATASVTRREKRVLKRLVRLLREELGPDLRAVWLYGSRARGEPPGEDSDVDLLVVSSRGRPDDDLRVIQLIDEAAEAEGENPVSFSVHLYTPERLEQRRAIRSFFIQEVEDELGVLRVHEHGVAFGEPPSSSRMASGFSTRRWSARFGGLAPYVGSRPASSATPLRRLR